jgi:hypothetical protein
VSRTIEAQPILRNRRAQRVPTEALETIALTGNRCRTSRSSRLHLVEPAEDHSDAGRRRRFDRALDQKTSAVRPHTVQAERRRQPEQNGFARDDESSALVVVLNRDELVLVAVEDLTGRRRPEGLPAAST